MPGWKSNPSAVIDQTAAYLITVGLLSGTKPLDDAALRSLALALVRLYGPMYQHLRMQEELQRFVKACGE